MDFTWRLCPSYSMNTSSAVDFLKTTNFRSSRFFYSQHEQFFPCWILKQASTLWVSCEHWMVWWHLTLLYIVLYCVLISFTIHHLELFWWKSSRNQKTSTGNTNEYKRCLYQNVWTLVVFINCVWLRFKRQECQHQLKQFQENVCYWLIKCHICCCSSLWLFKYNTKAAVFKNAYSSWNHQF